MYHRVEGRAYASATLQEQLAICLGLCTFRDVIRGRRVRVFCDNTGAESAGRRCGLPCASMYMRMRGLVAQAYGEGG